MTSLERGFAWLSVVLQLVAAAALLMLGFAGPINEVVENAAKLGPTLQAKSVGAAANQLLLDYGAALGFARELFRGVGLLLVCTAGLVVVAIVRKRQSPSK